MFTSEEKDYLLGMLKEAKQLELIDSITKKVM